MKKDFFATLSIFILSICCAFVFYQCKKTTDTTAQSTPTKGANEVWIQNMAFNPGSLTVTVNTTVKWTNKDGVAHTVTSTTGLFDSGSMNNNSTFTHQFTTAGTYPYKCSFHSGMTGTVIVQ